MEQAIGTDVTAELMYAIDTGEKPVNETFGPNNIRRRDDRRRTNVRPMTIRNGRPLARRVRARRATASSSSSTRRRSATSSTPTELKRVYYPEVER